MATDKNFIEYVCEQLSDVPDVSYKKMFGEYMVYSRGKAVILVCDNNCFVKILPETERLLEGASKGYPYDGAKLHFYLDIDDRELSAEVVNLLAQILPYPQKKKKI